MPRWVAASRGARMEKMLSQCRRDLAHMEANTMNVLAGDVGRRKALLGLIHATLRRTEVLTREEELADAVYCIEALKKVRTSYMGQRVGVVQRPQRDSLHDPPTEYRAGEIVLFRPSFVAGHLIIEKALPRAEIDSLLAKRRRFFTEKHLAGVEESDVMAVED